MAGPNALIFVRRSGLIVTGKRMTSARLEFNDKLVHNLDLLDSVGFVEQCRSFFEKQALGRKKVLIVLSQDVVFEKRIVEDKHPSEQELAAFVEAMPFERGNRAAFSVSIDNSTRICAANYALFTAILEAAEAAGAKTVAITPLTLYGLAPGQQLKSVVGELLKDTMVRKQADFAHCEPL